jgi:hypothetical protein
LAWLSPANAAFRFSWVFEDFNDAMAFLLCKGTASDCWVGAACRRPRSHSIYGAADMACQPI